LKYNEIMEKVEVTDEMRERILTNVSEIVSKREKKGLIFLNWKRMSILVACAAIVLLCVTALPSIMNTKKPTKVDLEQLANEIIVCRDIDELSQYAGFDINEISDIPFDIVECSYTWWFDSFAQIEYISDDNAITYRVAESEEDISGDCNDYSQIQEETIGQNVVTIKGNDDLAYLAIWTAGKYAYSISSSKGINYTEMKRMIDLVMGK